MSIYSVWDAETVYQPVSGLEEKLLILQIREDKQCYAIAQNSQYYIPFVCLYATTKKTFVFSPSEYKQQSFTLYLSKPNMCPTSPPIKDVIIIFCYHSVNTPYPRPMNTVHFIIWHTAAVPNWRISIYVVSWELSYDFSKTSCKIYIQY